MPTRQVAWKRIGSIAFSAGQTPDQNQFEINQPLPITMIMVQFALAAAASSWSSASAAADAVHRIIREIILKRGGKSVQSWGRDGSIGTATQMLEILALGWLGHRPRRDDPPSSLADHTLRMRVILPISLPEQYEFALRRQTAIEGAGDIETWTLGCRFGAVTDVFSGGTAVTITGTVYFSALVDTALNGAGNMPLETDPTVRTFATSATVETRNLGKGAFKNIASPILALDNSVRDQALINELTYKLDDNIRIEDTVRWEDLQGQAEFGGRQGLQAGFDDGTGWIDFDKESDLLDVPEPASESNLQVEVNHTGGTTLVEVMHQIIGVDKRVAA